MYQYLNFYKSDNCEQILDPLHTHSDAYTVEPLSHLKEVQVVPYSMKDVLGLHYAHGECQLLGPKFAEMITRF